MGGVLLLAFHHLIQLGQGLAATGRMTAEVAVGTPFFGLAAIAIVVFITSRKRPGDTPIGRLMEHISVWVARIRARASVRAAA